uniref:F-box and WD repeat domain containing 12 n=1 Tax=Molossus molossus TaxID=27622 RepID=A0A7J8DBC1_MOLMO|nr:F-box and WD repeat domain containing 12 [Molossus molossus]
MEIQLPEVPLLRIFSLLDGLSLLRVCQVNKYWNKVANSDHLWRNLCLKRWSFPYQCLGMVTWKQFFLTQTKRERRMACARPEDFVYKEATGNLGILGPMAYLSGGGFPMSGQEKSLICTVSSKRMLFVWDVQEVGNSEGDIFTLTVPELRNVSKVNAFNYSVDLLRCSPDKKWIFAGGIHQHIVPRVLVTECLLRPSADRAPLSVSLPFPFCCGACWAPRRANRITLMFRRASFKKTGFATFDLTTEWTQDGTIIQANQIASFLLPINMESPICMGVGDGNVIVFESGPHLFLFTINGFLLQQFQDHQLTICNLWVDYLRVLTTSMDNYLHLYTWEEEGRYPHLKSCCHLEHRRDDHAPSCYYSKAICDNTSIVCVVSRNRESSVLVMYSLNM